MVLPFEISEVIHATSSLESMATSSSVATAAISGTWKAMAGIWLAYWEEISCDPEAEKVPDGTGFCQSIIHDLRRPFTYLGIAVPRKWHFRTG